MENGEWEKGEWRKGEREKGRKEKGRKGNGKREKGERRKGEWRKEKGEWRKGEIRIFRFYNSSRLSFSLLRFLVSGHCSSFIIHFAFFWQLSGRGERLFLLIISRICLPLSVSRYFWFLLFGLSGMVISIR